MRFGGLGAVLPKARKKDSKPEFVAHSLSSIHVLEFRKLQLHSFFGSYSHPRTYFFVEWEETAFKTSNTHLASLGHAHFVYGGSRRPLKLSEKPLFRLLNRTISCTLEQSFRIAKQRLPVSIPLCLRQAILWNISSR